MAICIRNSDLTSTLKARAIKAGAKIVCGVDEAGRGPLAGPVVAAAVILDPANIPPGLNDSKKLTGKGAKTCSPTSSPRRRSGVGIADVARIDRDNILDRHHVGNGAGGERSRHRAGPCPGRRQPQPDLAVPARR